MVSVSVANLYCSVLWPRALKATSKATPQRRPDKKILPNSNLDLGLKVLALLQGAGQQAQHLDTQGLLSGPIRH